LIFGAMKAKQSGGPAKLVHRCFVAYRAGASAFFFAVAAFTFPLNPLSLRAEVPKGPEDFAQVYVDQYFEPSESLKLSDESRRKSKALAHYSLGRSLEAQRKLPEAIEAYSEVLRNQPDQFFLARKTAYLLARAGRQDEALKMLEDSLARNPGEPLAHIALSEFLATYEGGDPAGLKRSFEVIEQAVKQFPDEPAVYEHLVKLYLSADRRDEARALVSEAATRENRDSQYWLRLGRIAARVWPVGESGKISEDDLVNQIHAKALEFANGDASVIERVGDFYHATGQFDRAIAAFSGLIGKQTDRLDLREKLAQVYGAKGDEEKVVQTLKEIVEIDPQNADVHKQIAGIFLRAERFKEAIPHLQTSLSITKGSATEYGALGRMMIESEENEVAVKFLVDAAYLFPDSPDFPFLLTFTLARLERWDEAIKQFEKTIGLAGDEQPQLLNEGFYFRYAAAHERRKDFAKAEELFRKTIEMIAKNDPADENKEFTATVYNYLGYMWIENDMKIDEAGELIKTAAELDPESGAIADSLGWFHFKKGRFDAARDELLRAESLLEDEDAVIYDHIGQAFYQLGEAAKAIEYLEKAVAKEPGNTEFSDRLKRMRDGTEKRLEPTAVEKKE
jgi:tetratricopeptide (TPR) repeat protein